MSVSKQTKPSSSTDVFKVPNELKKLKEFDCLISYDDALKSMPKSSISSTSAAHVLIWSKPDRDVFKSQANLMMHLRFDGKFGFPGGLIDCGEDPLTALNRELAEEIGLPASEMQVSWKDYISSMVEPSDGYFLHFFVMEISPVQYTSLEKKCLEAPEYGKEVLGTVRIPLYTRKDNYGGFPAFLDNVFVSKAKYQLLLGLYHAQIMTEAELLEAYRRSNGGRSTL